MTFGAPHLSSASGQPQPLDLHRTDQALERFVADVDVGQNAPTLGLFGSGRIMCGQRRQIPPVTDDHDDVRPVINNGLRGPVDVA